MAVRDFADVYTRTPRDAGPKGKGVQQKSNSRDIYHSGHTHLIGERITDHSPCLFYTLASDDRLWFQLCGQIALRTLFLQHYVSTHPRNFRLWD